MITIELTNETIAGEPGPNFYWRGTPEDFLRLIRDLHRLGRDHGGMVSVKDLDYVEVLGGYSVELKSNKGSNKLCDVRNKAVDVDIDRKLWQRMLSTFLSISFYPSHDYIDFEDVDLLEDANFIVSSES